MSELLAGFAGIIVGAVVESITYIFKRRWEKQAELADQLSAELEQLAVMYEFRHPTAPDHPDVMDKLVAVKLALVRLLRFRKGLFRGKLNRRLTRDFGELVAVRGCRKDLFVFPGETRITAEDAGDHCRKATAIVRQMLRDIDDAFSVL